MTIETVPSSLEEQVLLIIGDEEEELITIDVIAYILANNEDNVNLAAIEAIRYIIGYLTKRIDEEVGDIKVKFSQLLKNYKDLLKELLTDPSFALSLGLHRFGGVSKSASKAIARDTDSRRGPISEGFYTKNRTNCLPNENNYFFLDCDD